MELSIIIPVYNESANIHKLYSRLKEVVEKMSLSYELIFINDGSKDDSLSLILELSKKDSTLKYINLSRNFGHQVAVSAGIDYSKGSAICIIDADLQDPPELIPSLYSKLKDGFQVVYAKRRSRKGEGVLKKTTAKLFYRVLSKITSIPIPIDTGDFRIVEKKVADVLKKMPEEQKFLRGQISWVGFKQTFIEYDRDERVAGKTGYTYRKMFRFALDGITAFSNFPLKFATIMGMSVSLVSFIVILYVLYSRFILKSYVAGWTSVMISVLFIGGIQLLCIGIIGEYIGRISANVRKRPLYIINETNIEE